uniref:Uncharacterized protein n=1 Tax=Alexandrium catenella TaxID=2925 RepID=A0A7S1MET1_ALECA
MILETLAILDFQLQEGTGLGKYAACRPLCECAARCIVSIKQSCLVFSFGLAGLICYLSVSSLGRKASMADAIGPFLLSRAQSWTLWFVIDGLTPCCGFLARWCLEGRPARCGVWGSVRPRAPDVLRPGATRYERKDGLRKELTWALEALAKKREEAALLQWRIHHLEAELLELESMDAGLPDPTGGLGVPVPWGTASFDQYDPKDMVGAVSRPSGWQTA